MNVVLEVSIIDLVWFSHSGACFGMRVHRVHSLLPVKLHFFNVTFSGLKACLGLFVARSCLLKQEQLVYQHGT